MIGVVMNNNLQKLIDGQHLSAEEVSALFSSALQSNNAEQIAALLVLLRAKGETADEINGIVTILKNVMIPVSIPGAVLDIVGTGGDFANTVNISTAAALVASCAGVNVVKHGNRAVSSKCGSADFLESCGININLNANEVARQISKHQFSFCLAPNFHPVFSKIRPIRNALGVRTLFNLIGPLLNPANAQHLLVGVFDENYVGKMAKILQQQAVQHAMVVHSQGLDEISLLGPATVSEIRNGEITNFTLDPKNYGFSYCKLKDLQGGDAQQNQQILFEIFTGYESPLADTIALNAAVGLYCADFVDSIDNGLVLANSILKSGAVLNKIEQIKAASHA